MRTTVQLPDDLLKRAKRKAAADGRTLTSLIEEGLRSVLAGTPQGPPSKRIRPRISRATGGLMPGVDPIKLLQQVEEMDDIEMMHRLAIQK